VAKKQPLTTLLGFRAEDALVKRIQDEADRAERPKSWIIRKLLLRALAQNEKTA
jgi:predicted transcriptional regulator